MDIIYICIFSASALLMLIIYFKNYKGLSFTTWKPGAAWLRAGIYFCICNIIFALSGALEILLSQPIITIIQITNPYWIIYACICIIYVSVAYWVLWSRMTLTFDRKFNLGPQIVFGVIWGYSTGGLLLSFYHLWSLLTIPGWGIYLLSFTCMGLWQYVAQDYFWDIYVSPEHDTPKSIIIKTLVCHIPNLAIALGFLVLWENYFIFILIFIIALIASTIFQKFPAPWAKGDFHAPLTKKGVFNLPRGNGYIENTNSESKV